MALTWRAKPSPMSRCLHPVYSIDTHWKDASVQMWNFNIQHELGYNVVLQVAYIGNHGSHLARETFPNEPLPAPGLLNRYALEACVGSDVEFQYSARTWLQR